MNENDEKFFEFIYWISIKKKLKRKLDYCIRYDWIPLARLAKYSLKCDESIVALKKKEQKNCTNNIELNCDKRQFGEIFHCEHWRSGSNILTFHLTCRHKNETKFHISVINAHDDIYCNVLLCVHEFNLHRLCLRVFINFIFMNPTNRKLSIM